MPAASARLPNANRNPAVDSALDFFAASHKKGESAAG